MRINDLRPHLVLECPFGKNRIGELERGEARVLCEEVRFGAKKSSQFVQDLARRRKERARAWESRDSKVRN